MYPNLKLHIFKVGIHQNQLAKHVGIADTILSKIIHGYREPTADQKKMIAAFLSVDERWLFEKYDGSDNDISNAVWAPQESKGGNS